MTYVDLFVEAKTTFDRQVFTYSVPIDFENDLKIGLVVNIPFGRQKIRGLVIKIHKSKPSYSTKPILSVTDLIFSRPQIDTITWLSNYYLVTFGEALKMFLPPKMVRPQKPCQYCATAQECPKLLSQDQQNIYESIKLQLDSKPQINLLHGVTGSGKTEIFVHLINDVIEKDGQVIYLLPEIFLASQILIRLQSVFGSKIAILHSKISRSEVFDIYSRFNSGELKIIIGPRSALLVQPKNLKLIIVDEEHDDSYKQEQAPRYDARLLAEKIAVEQKAVLILASATPRVTSFIKHLQKKINYFELKERYNQQMPEATVVDMRDEFKKGNYSVISEKLAEELKNVVDAKKQAIVFLNRRGLATFVSCRECGYVYDCPNCSIPLTNHLTDSSTELHCHHCGYITGLPARCPACGGVYMKSFGSGVQKIEMELNKLFPKARVLRIDSDLKESELKAQIRKIEKHQFDILLGTQMIAKGLDLPKVDLVGIISADTALHLPDYLSNEKTFDLITQVSGRSGRRDLVGKTIIQTYWPDNHAIVCAAQHNYQGFVENELPVRKAFNYPPYKNIVRVISQHTDRTKAKTLLKKLALRLKENNFDFTGPAPAFYKRIRGRFRYHLVIKFDSSERRGVYDILKNFPDPLIDIDPVNML